jgi:signal transduction histidine kinase
MNLLFNSMQALSETVDARQKVISIQSRSDGRNGIIDFSDNGPGVSKGMENFLFNILSTSKDSGMGLGLWLCKYIVERHNGSIAHAPPRLGGATFVIKLPQQQSQTSSRNPYT